MRLSKVCLTSNVLGLPVGCQSGPVVSEQSTEVANHESGLVLEVSHLMDGDEKVGLGHLDGASNLGRQKMKPAQERTR